MWYFLQLDIYLHGRVQDFQKGVTIILIDDYLLSCFQEGPITPHLSCIRVYATYINHNLPDVYGIWCWNYKKNSKNHKNVYAGLKENFH